MSKVESVRCRKCGKECNARVPFHTCDHTEYDHGVNDAIAAVRGIIWDDRPKNLDGPSMHWFEVKAIAAIRKTTGVKA